MILEDVSLRPHGLMGLAFCKGPRVDMSWVDYHGRSNDGSERSHCKTAIQS